MNRPSLKAVIIPLVSLIVLIVVGYIAYNSIVKHRAAPTSGLTQGSSVYQLKQAFS